MSFFFRLGDVVSVPVPPAEEMRYVVKCGTSMKFEKSSKKNGLSPVKSTSTAVFNAFALARFGHKSGTVEAINKVKLGAFLKVCCRITNKRVIVKVISLLYCSIYVFLWYLKTFIFTGRICKSKISRKQMLRRLFWTYSSSRFCCVVR